MEVVTSSMNVAHKNQWLLVAILLLSPGALAQRQEHPASAIDPILTAHQFTRALYPDLSGKNYSVFVETRLRYDQPGNRITWLQLNIGEGPKNAVLGYSGGCVSDPPGLPALPTPPELEVPQATNSATPSASSSTASVAKRPVDCTPGPIHPKQFLSNGFWFNNDGRLTDYVIDGVRDREKINALTSLVLSHPEMTYSNVVEALKNAGAKYGPSDKEEFIRNLPLSALEPFLGKLQIIKVEFGPLWENHYNIGSWPDWKVTMKSEGTNGAESIYQMSFDQFRGDLTSLHLVSPKQTTHN